MTELILPRNNISGEIPSELGMLSFLQELRLHRNSLRGEINEINRGKFLENSKMLSVCFKLRSGTHGHLRTCVLFFREATTRSLAELSQYQLWREFLSDARFKFN